MYDSKKRAEIRLTQFTNKIQTQKPQFPDNLLYANYADNKKKQPNARHLIKLSSRAATYSLTGFW